MTVTADFTDPLARREFGRWPSGDLLQSGRREAVKISCLLIFAARFFCLWSLCSWLLQLMGSAVSPKHGWLERAPGAATGLGGGQAGYPPGSVSC